MNNYDSQNYPLQEETSLLISIGYSVYNQLGKGFLEIVYKDAFEYELRKRCIEYTREKQYNIHYQGVVLPHCFFADFVVFDNLILEVKSAEGISEAYVAQTLNYLKVSNCKVGLILNFGETSLKIKRIVL